MRGSTDLGEPIARDRAIRKPEVSTAAKFPRDLVRLLKTTADLVRYALEHSLIE